MNFRLLGDLEVLIDGRTVRLAGHKQRALVAVLLLHANEVVGADRLIEDLWGDEPPTQAAKSVHVHVWRLRTTLAAASGGQDADGRVLTRPAGYTLRVEPGELDIGELERLLRAGVAAIRDGKYERAGELLRDGLALWRGPPLAEFAHESFAQQEIARLSELRLQALQERIDADLALGRHAGLVGELEALVADHPLAERVHAQLMLALYRSGRQADALEHYRQTRRVLQDELGLEPGQAIARLQHAILNHEPELNLAPVAGPLATPVEPEKVDSGSVRGTPRRPARVAGARRLRPPAVLGVALALVAAAVIAIVLIRAHRAGQVIATGNSVAVIDPSHDRVVATMPVGVGPDSIAAGAGGLWVANTGDHTVSAIDVASRRVSRTLAFGDSLDGVAAGSSALWTVDSTRGVAQRVDPTFRTVVRRVPIGDVAGVGNSPNALAIGDGAAWVATDASTVVRIPDRGAISRIDVGNDPSGIAIGAGATWVADAVDGSVSRIDSTGVSAPIPVGPGASGIVVGGGAVWVADTLADTLVRIDPASNTVTTTIAVGSRPRGVAWGDGSVWVANSGDGTVSRVEPRTNRASATIPVGQSPQALVVGHGAVWVSVASRPAAVAPAPSSASGELRIVREEPLSSIDPAENGDNFDPEASQMYYATCAGLLTYPDRPAPQGSRLVPDVAKALPALSRDRRTYTFTVRSGFRFSPPSGAPVTAATFKHTIERALGPKLKSYARSYMGDIAGMAAYQAGRTRHLAGVVAHGDRLQIHLTAPAPTLPARIATLSFCASPDDTPPATGKYQPIPSAGPYYVVSSTRDQLVLEHNPNYGGHRPRSATRIVYSFGVPLTRAVDEVATGRSDYVDFAPFVASGSGPAALARIQALEQRFGARSAAARTGGQRYFVTPTLDVEYLTFNTARPPFASARLRRAVNYAIDRRALAQHSFLNKGELAIDHYLPPGIPGSRLVDIYPLGRPDLAKARRLANGVHAHATLYTCTVAPQCLQDAHIVQTDLRAIGITVDIRAFPLRPLYARLSRTGEPWDIAFTNWGADYPDPFNMINELFDPASAFNLGRFNDPALTVRMRAAARLSGASRLHAYARLDEALARYDPPMAAWGIGTLREFFSTRVGCQVFQPIYGTDLGSLCLRS